MLVECWLCWKAVPVHSGSVSSITCCTGCRRRGIRSIIGSNRITDSGTSISIHSYSNSCSTSGGISGNNSLTSSSTSRSIGKSRSSNRNNSFSSSSISRSMSCFGGYMVPVIRL